MGGPIFLDVLTNSALKPDSVVQLAPNLHQHLGKIHLHQNLSLGRELTLACARSALWREAYVEKSMG